MATSKPDSTDFLRVSDLSGATIERLLVHAATQREAQRCGVAPRWCAGRRVAFIWDGEGFRNRAAFEISVAEAGGTGIEIPGALGEREAIGDLAAYLHNWFDALVVRTPSFSRLQEFADHAVAPVINARTSHNHPCEILGDLAFVHHARGGVNGLTVMFVGAPTNLCNSWCEAAAVLDLTVIQVCPIGYEIDRTRLASLSPDLPGRVSISHRPQDVIDTADIIYTDRWPAPDVEHDRKSIEEQFASHRVTAALLAQAAPQALFLPCPPVTRGADVSANAMQDERCRVVEAKDWLLHAQAALLAEMLPPPH
jgi:ornithine carbamoyltransferase